MAKKTKSAVKTSPEPVILKGYKGFDKNLACNGGGSNPKQYAVGETYEETEARLCHKGMHFCENPLDAFGYYPPSDGRYCEVEAENPTDETHGDSKRVTSKLRIKAELSILMLVQAGVDFILSRIDRTKEQAATNTGDRSAAKVEGEESIAMSCGIEGKAAGSLGSWLVLSEWKVEGGKWHRVDTQCVKVDGEKIKVDTWYKLQGGEFVEVDDE